MSRFRNANTDKGAYEAATPLEPKPFLNLLCVSVVLTVEVLWALLKSIPIGLMLLKNILMPPERKIIRGQVALVTGGANGLGRGICLVLAKKGCILAVADLDLANAEKTAADCRELYKVQAVAYKLDVSDFKAIESLRSRIEEDVGPVDILVNNAGLLTFLSLREGTPEEVQRIINVNLASHFWTIRVFLDGMIARRRGHIVGISSLAGLVGQGRGIAYCATKHGVRGLMESLYDELSLDKLDDVIHTTTVYPYFINTSRVISDLRKKVSAMDKLPITTTEVASEIIVEAIQRNNKSLMVPRFYYPFINFVMSLPIEIQKVMKNVIISTDVPNLYDELEK